MIFQDNKEETKFLVYVPFLQDEKMSYIFKHGTELGITDFVVVEYERCKYKLPKKDYEKKLLRWNKIIKEASEQSYRIHKPNLEKIISVKEVRLSPTIDVGDFNTKQKAAKKFLMDGDKVKVSCRFRGRMIEHAENTIPLFTKFAEGLAEVGKVDQNPYLDGRNMFMMLSPKIQKKKN